MSQDAADYSSPAQTPPNENIVRVAQSDPGGGLNTKQALPAATVIDARPAAIINGGQVNWGELRPLLNEAAGAEVLQEVILGRALQQRIADAGVNVSENDIENERRVLLESLHDDPAVARRLLDELRRRQGLGQQRFRNLLKHNAMLRALVQNRVSVTDEQIRRMHEIMYGPRRQARIITSLNLTEIESARDRIAQGEFFSDVAVDVSTDASAARGGLLEPISRSDPVYPEVLRRELWGLGTNELSNPILLDNQYVLLRFEREYPGDDVPLNEAYNDVNRAVRLSQERVLMDQLARRLIDDISVTVFDPALRESWAQAEATNLR